MTLRNNSLVLGLAAVLGIAGRNFLSAQEAAPPPEQANPDSDQDSPQGTPPQPAPNPEESPEPASPANSEMPPEDAGDNFRTVITSFIANRSPKGYWPLKDKATGRIMRLKLVKVNAGNLRKLKSNNYAGSAVLKDVERGTLLKVEFGVDFSGAEWKVTGMRILTKSAPPKRKP